MDREPMTKDKERDALIVEKKQLAYFLECKEGTVEAEAMFRRAAALLRGDEQPKPNRAEVLAEEIWPYLRSLSRDRLVPILNRHFDELRAEWEAERPAVVVPFGDDVIAAARFYADVPVAESRIVIMANAILDGAKGGV